MKKSWLKKALVTVSCLSLAGGIFGGYGSVSASNPASVFEEDAIERELEEARSQVVAPDKGQSRIQSSLTGKMKASTYATAHTPITGTYPTRRGVILVTSDYYKDLLPTGHAAIIASSDQVIEALSNGVVYGKNNWNVKKNDCWAVTCGATSVNEDRGTVTYIERNGYVGKPYNFNFYDVNQRQRFYCSQLVWAAYKDSLGIDLNTSEFGAAIHPLELVNSPRTVTIYMH